MSVGDAFVRDVKPEVAPDGGQPLAARWRFALTVVANLLRAVFGFVAGMLLARWMGPGGFGNLAFLLGSFLAVRQLLDLGASTAFYTFLSQRGRTRGFVVRYGYWLSLQYVLPLLVIGVALPASWIEVLWPAQGRGLVVLALTAAYFQNNIWPAAQQVGESQRRTVSVQGIGVAIAAGHLMAIALLWYYRRLNVPTILTLIAIEFLLGSLWAGRRIRFADGDEEFPEGASSALFVKKFAVYCAPLVPYTIVGFAQDFVDRWLLQRHGGAAHQAYYAVAAQIASISLLATSSMLRIFWKEVAEAHHRGDHSRVHELFVKVSRFLYFIAAAGAGFVLPWSAEILRLLLGAQYSAGALTLSVMCVYPAHQALGQVSATMLYATEQPRLVVTVGIGAMLAGLAMTYFVLTPGTAAIPGLGMGSTGLAIKMVVIQAVSVNLLLFALSRAKRWPFDWFYQVGALVGMIIVGYFSRTLVSVVVGDGVSTASAMFVAALVFCPMAVGTVIAWPSIAGLTTHQLQGVWGGIRSFLGIR